MTDAELSLDSETFRRLGYRVVAALAARMSMIARLGALAADAAVV